MRFFAFISALLFAVGVLAESRLVPELEKLDRIVRDMNNNLERWNGGYGGLAKVALPTITQSTTLVRTINEIIKTGNSEQLDRRDAERVIDRLRQAHEERGSVTRNIIRQKENFTRINRGFLDAVQMISKMTISLSDETHAAIRHAVPNRYKREVQRLGDRARDSLARIQEAYSG